MSDLFLRLDWASAGGRDQQSLIEDEFRAERASSLGMAGRRLERALAALEDCDDAGRENLIEPAARAASNECSAIARATPCPRAASAVT